MKVLFLTTVLTFVLIPRRIPLVTDNLILTLRNETTDLTITPAFVFSIVKGRYLQITITSQPTDFATQNKYEIQLKNTDLIYSGKLIVLEKNTDVQNYKYGSQSTSIFEYS